MAATHLGQVLADAWEQTMRETPDPFSDQDGIFNSFFGLPSLSYRERLDKQRRNQYGDLIPRIVTVRRHLRLYMRIPSRPPRLPA